MGRQGRLPPPGAGDAHRLPLPAASGALGGHSLAPSPGQAPASLTLDAFPVRVLDVLHAGHDLPVHLQGQNPSQARWGSPGQTPPSTPRSLCLTRKEIFIRYSTPSFSTKDCFLKLSRSPVPRKKIVLKTSVTGSCYDLRISPRPPSAAAGHPFRSHPDPGGPRQPHPGRRPLHSQSPQTLPGCTSLVPHKRAPALQKTISSGSGKVLGCPGPRMPLTCQVQFQGARGCAAHQGQAGHNNIGDVGVCGVRTGYSSTPPMACRGGEAAETQQ